MVTTAKSQPQAEVQEAAIVPIATQFIKTTGFTGSKPEYVFKKGKSGLGCYKDALLMKKQAKKMKKIKLINVM